MLTTALDHETLAKRIESDEMGKVTRRVRGQALQEKYPTDLNRITRMHSDVTNLGSRPTDSKRHHELYGKITSQFKERRFNTYRIVHNRRSSVLLCCLRPKRLGRCCRTVTHWTG